MKILLAGGGSGGSVSPLLAVANKIKTQHPKVHFLLVGTNSGPEKNMAEGQNLEFAAITAVKLRRYFSWTNFLSPFLFLGAFYQSYKILKSYKPDCVFGAGSFVQVPIIWAAWFLKIPIIIHQQDVVLSLANKLCQLVASKITVTFPESQANFSSSLGIFYRKNPDKIMVTGNPFREQLTNGDKQKATSHFKLKTNFPTLLVLGGGTGAEFLNRLIIDCLPNLTKTVQIIHSTGQGKGEKTSRENYHGVEFLNETDLADAYAAADMVLSRAGLSVITELAHLKKLSIIVPMPNSHQEINGLYLISKQAAIVIPQHKITANNFTGLIRKLVFAQEAKIELEEGIGKLMPKNATQKIAETIIKLAEK
ncbi:MAG: UDP-N-acetylglucosamine--N-acetylmuramyl-(pentapeptide) pyrophosphoryl-undecaprenol N-acetylglucosamine transferase [Candidatus Doudnabacteria bacterium]|jgi:UDP-N-acetylglucosamine--N-acetylmuramyl-(pentapeptide) pyrophosphoryl-undecaprenol N-acetylglucosamine transferase